VRVSPVAERVDVVLDRLEVDAQRGAARKKHRRVVDALRAGRDLEGGRRKAVGGHLAEQRLTGVLSAAGRRMRVW
jgi:hypothetical protein